VYIEFVAVGRDDLEVCKLGDIEGAASLSALEAYREPHEHDGPLEIWHLVLELVNHERMCAKLSEG